VGEQQRADELRARLSVVRDLEIDYTDGEEEDDYKEYDVIFDLNADDDPSHVASYLSLKETPVFLSVAKLSLAEQFMLVTQK